MKNAPGIRSGYRELFVGTGLRTVRSFRIVRNDIAFGDPYTPQVCHPERNEVKPKDLRTDFLYAQPIDPPKAPLCKGGCHFALQNDWGIDGRIVLYRVNPSVENQRFSTPPLTQGRQIIAALRRCHFAVQNDREGQAV